MQRNNFLEVFCQLTGTAASDFERSDFVFSQVETLNLLTQML